MGISSREYVRDDSPVGGGNWSSGASVCQRLIIATVIVFIAQIVLTREVPAGPGGLFSVRVSVLDEWGAFIPDAVLHGQVWRLVTYAFLHSRQDVLHILFNMMGLWFFGSILERTMSGREFLLFYLSAALFAGLGFLVWGLILGRMNPMVGASGAVLAVMMLFACHYPRHEIHLFGLIPIEARWLVALYAFFDMLPVLQQLGGAGIRTNIAHTAHLAGLLFGWLYFRCGWKLERWLPGRGGWSSFRRLTTRRNLRVYRPHQVEPVDLEAEVDRILEKIHQQGTESLTDRERRTMERASKEYKKRQ